MASNAPLEPLPFKRPNGSRDIAATDHADAPPSAPLNGFPGAQTTFVGRSAERAALRSFLLDPNQRLITVLGPGGIGKTRLAIVAARDAADAFPGGATFIALSELREPGEIAGALASAISVQEHPDRPILKSVLAALAHERLLLALDNLEHLMGADLQDLVTRILHECPGVTILATSREPLHIAPEQRMVLAPMQLPEAASTAAIAATESVELFLARARAVTTTFVPGPADFLDIAEVCRRVEGIPLAIELAAAWMRVLSPAALLAQFDEQLPLLTGGGTDQPVRLRTMRDAIAWSYDRLSAEEAALLRKLSVFRGGFPLDAASRLTSGDSAAAPLSALHLVASLCDKNLLVRSDAIGEVQRFTMLETVREFAFGKLRASGEEHTTRAAHARFYQDMAEQIEPELLGHRENHWFAFYSAETSNLREAILWGLEHEPEVALRVLSASWAHWSWRRAAEGLRLISAALALPPTQSGFVRARALRTATALANLTGNHEAAAALAAEGMTSIERIDNRWLQGELLWNSACCALLSGDPALACDRFDLALARMDAPGSDTERTMRAYARSHRGATRCLMQDYGLGARDYAESVEELRQVNGVAVNIIVLSDAAGWLLIDEQTNAAKALLHEALCIAARAHTPWLMVTPLSGLAMIDAMEGNAIRAAKRMGAITTMVKRADLVTPPNFQTLLDRTESQASGALGRAAYFAAWETGHRSPASVLEEAFAVASEKTQVTGENGEKPRPRLTPRERQVLQLIVTGCTDRDIAVKLFISNRTVSKHVSRILGKLDAVSRGDAAVRAVRMGLA